MDIEYYPQENSIFIHTGQSHLQIPNNCRVIFVNDKIHFVKPGADITNYAEHAILKWGSNSEESVPTLNVIYINTDNVESNLETYLKNVDTKLSTIPTLPISAQDVRVRDIPEVNLAEELTDIKSIIASVIHNLERLRVVLASHGIKPADWKQPY
jgi:hypothetical protein